MDEKTLEIINRIAREHSRNLKRRPFGYLDRNDLKNEIWAICLDKIKDYDPNKGELEHFLRVLVKNRLVNRFKDITKSVRPPCPRCEFYDPKSKDGIDCKKFGEDKHNCSKWRNYQLSTESRNSLLNSAEPKNERCTREDILQKVSTEQLKEIVKLKITRHYQRDLEQLISGGKIPKQRLKKLRKEILRILDEHSLPIVNLTINKIDKNEDQKENQ